MGLPPNHPFEGDVPFMGGFPEIGFPEKMDAQWKTRLLNMDDLEEVPLF